MSKLIRMQGRIDVMERAKMKKGWFTEVRDAIMEGKMTKIIVKNGTWSCQIKVTKNYRQQLTIITNSEFRYRRSMLVIIDMNNEWYDEYVDKFLILSLPGSRPTSCSLCILVQRSLCLLNFRKIAQYHCVQPILDSRQFRVDSEIHSVIHSSITLK